NEANALDWLPKVQCPVLGLYPTGGPITDAEQERLLTTHLKNFKLVHLPTEYHMVHHIVPEACTTELLQFLAQHP
ncbi:MAG: alpha/beta hydrolase, partial [Betaproteobacteria bacterium]|nr:alpha/beta hydrolase [Betaproteobacteria bacterium]